MCKELCNNEVMIMVSFVVRNEGKELPYQRFKIMSYENVVRPHVAVDDTTNSALFVKIP